MEGLTVNKWVVNVVRPLPAYNWGRVALLGDAVRFLVERNSEHHGGMLTHLLVQAHACTPFQGAGAGNAIEVRSFLRVLLMLTYERGTLAGRI